MSWSYVSSAIIRSARAEVFRAARLSIAAALAFAAPVSAWAEFGPPTSLSPLLADPGMDRPRVAVNAQGEGLFVWAMRPQDGGRRIAQAKFRAADGTLGPVENIVIPSTGDPEIGIIRELDVAMDGAGNALIAWHLYYIKPGGGRRHRIEARIRSASGVLSPVEVIGQGGQTLAMAMNADGDALLAWHVQDSAATNVRIRARFRSRTGTLGPILTLSPPESHAVWPSVAIDEAGIGVVTWVQASLIRARRVSEAGLLGELVTLSDLPQSADVPRVALDSDGDATVAWAFIVPNPGAPVGGVNARRYFANGTLGPIAVLFAQRALAVDVAAEPDGDAVVVWQSQGTDEIKLRSVSAASVVGPLRAITPTGVPARNPIIDMDQTGTAWIAWEHGASPSSVIRVRPRLPNNSIGPAQQLSGPVAVTPEIAVGAEGDALVTWRRTFGGQVRFQASAGP